MKKINKYLLIALFAGFLSSCEDAYQVAPGDEIVDENAITSVEDVESAVIGAYSGIGNIENSIEFSTVFTDEINIASSNNGQGIQPHNFSINPGTDDIETLFKGYYVPISRANRVLAAMPRITAINDAEQLRLNRSKGEMLFIRAYCHFDLLRYFAPSFTDLAAPGVPYADFVVVTEQLPRNTVGEVYEKLEKDLTEAAALIPATDSFNGKVTLDAINGLRARIALYKGDYATAIALSSPLITKYPLVDAGSFSSIWLDATTAEVIFKLKRVGNESRIGLIFIDNAGTVYYNPSSKLLGSYDPTDVRVPVYFSEDGTVVTKYPGVSGSFGLNDLKLIRSAEMVLLRSEAYAKTNQLALAAADYNYLRTARQTNFTAISFTTTANAVNEILDESFREFAFEGVRFFDLKRNAKPIERNAQDCATQTNGICTLAATDYRFALPFPTSEIFVNKSIVQNPGY